MYMLIFILQIHISVCVNHIFKHLYICTCLFMCASVVCVCCVYMCVCMECACMCYVFVLVYKYLYVYFKDKKKEKAGLYTLYRLNSVLPRIQTQDWLDVIILTSVSSILWPIIIKSLDMDSDFFKDDTDSNA